MLFDFLSSVLYLLVILIHKRTAYGRFFCVCVRGTQHRFAPAARCWLSYEPENDVARNLYRSFGFEEQPLPSGWDEVPAVLEL